MTSTTAFPLPGTSDARVVARAVRESPGLLVARTRKWSRISTSGGAVDRSNNAEGARALRASRVTRAIAARPARTIRMPVFPRCAGPQRHGLTSGRDPRSPTQPSSFPPIPLVFQRFSRWNLPLRCEEVNPALIEPATVQPRQGPPTRSCPPPWSFASCATRRRSSAGGRATPGAEECEVGAPISPQRRWRASAAARGGFSAPRVGG